MNENITYGELISMITVDPDLKKPTEKYLKENFDVICTSPDNSAVCYSCGYVVYRDTSGYAIFLLSKCRTYTYESGSTFETKLSEEQVAEMTWYFPVIAYGASRVEYNQNNQERKKRYEPNDDEELEDIIGGKEDDYRDDSVDILCDCLTEKQREMLVLNAICGYTQAEIAEIMGVTLSTVSRTVKYAKDKVRKFVECHNL